jgi:hypothetical protein
LAIGALAGIILVLVVGLNLEAATQRENDYNIQIGSAEF